jgi:hypothetical protein
MIMLSKDIGLESLGPCGGKNLRYEGDKGIIYSLEINCTFPGLLAKIVIIVFNYLPINFKEKARETI